MNPQSILKALQERIKGVQGMFGSRTYANEYPENRIPESERVIKLPSDTQQSAPVAQAMQQRATPQPQMQINMDEIEKKIRQGYQKYSRGKGVPIEGNIPQMVEAAKKYPIFQKYPYLIPAVSIAETQGGKNYTLNNNPLSWAARIQKEGGYTPTSTQQSIQDMITAVGGDPNRGEGYDPETARTRMSTAAIYKNFRDTGDLQEFTNRYEPPANNPRYHKDIEWLMNQFNSGGDF